MVLRLLSKEEPAVPIARWATGVSEQTLYRWRDEFLRSGQQALRGRGAEAEQTKLVQRLTRKVLTVAGHPLRRTSAFQLPLALRTTVAIGTPRPLRSACTNLYRRLRLGGGGSR